MTPAGLGEPRGGGYRARVSETRTGSPAIDALVDWDLAVRTASRLVRPGPQVSREAAAEVVGQLREFAARSTAHVARTTRLQTSPGDNVLVVDRPGWVQANVEAFRVLLSPVVEEAVSRRRHLPNPLVSAVGSRVTGAEVGSLLSFLASRVLGQYDAFDSGGGRLLLVAPNVVQVERELDLDPTDFRLWVCLHEETHRVQFEATPWLRDHLLDRIRGLVGDLLGEPGAVLDRLTSGLRNLPEMLRGTDGSGAGLLDLVQTPEQRRALAEVTAVMSLLEGHADVVMDDVGPSVIRTVEEIRSKFTKRRAGRGAVDQLLRRLLGLEAKMRQYADGAKFVRGAIDSVGVDGFNAVWSAPEHLPTPEEISAPREWVRRVHG
jgi:coenzyme F420 biosynthesis associated uncharacterized protein